MNVIIECDYCKVFINQGWLSSIIMEERTNSLLTNSVEIENRVRQLSEKLDQRLRQSVGVDS